MLTANALNLDAFQRQSHIEVQHEQYDWANAWQQILSVALYQKGPDVSEVGSTWLDNLGDMNALRPFSPSELRSLGGEAAFLPNTWHHLLSSGGLVVSIPWTVDTRLVIYRQDWLAKANVDPQSAFQTPEALRETLQRLRAAGLEYPLAMATRGLTFHLLAPFVWGRGGGFRSPDLQKITLVEPEARQGMLDYYQLQPFINPEDRLLDYAGADQSYLQGKAAVLLSGQWVIQALKQQFNLLPEVRENSACALPPGVPFVGGSYLVIWRHGLHDSESIQLISYLTSPEVMRQIFSQAASFPARLEALALPPFSDDPDYQVVIECIRRGRSFRTARRWATIELRLNAFYEQLWEDLFTEPHLDLPREIEKRTRELASHLERTVLAN